MTIVTSLNSSLQVPSIPAPLKEKIRSVSQVSCMTVETEECESSLTDSESTGDLAPEDTCQISIEEPQLLDDHPPMKRHSEPLMVRRRSSILKPTSDDIPVKNRGWKNLPPLNQPHSLSRHSSAPSSTTTTPRRNSQTNNNVQFRDVHIRCYDLTIGDNPAVSYGTPISLDWDYEQMEPIALDVFESSRQNQRRKPRQMMMNYYTRRNLLTYTFGYTPEQLNAAEKVANKARNQRSLTKALLPTMLLEDFVGSVGRKTKRLVGVVGKKKCKQQSGVPPGTRTCSVHKDKQNVVVPSSPISSTTTTTPPPPEPSDGPVCDTNNNDNDDDSDVEI